MSPAESLVMQEIASHANIQGQNSRISYEALAAATDFSEQWVKQLVKRLEAKHLLRVHRQWIGYAKCAVNRYDLIRPWLRELTYTQAYARKQETSAHLSRQGSVDPHPIRGEKQLQGACQPPDRRQIIQEIADLEAGLASLKNRRNLLRQAVFPLLISACEDNQKRRLNEKPSKCLQQGPNAGERLSDCRLTKHNLINSL
jgi:DNA-binding Lrp family transcriptional regulator